MNIHLGGRSRTRTAATSMVSAACLTRSSHATVDAADRSCRNQLWAEHAGPGRLCLASQPPVRGRSGAKTRRKTLGDRGHAGRLIHRHLKPIVLCPYIVTHASGASCLGLERFGSPGGPQKTPRSLIRRSPVADNKVSAHPRVGGPTPSDAASRGQFGLPHRIWFGAASGRYDLRTRRP